MDNLEMVFLGTHTFTFTLPSTAQVEKENHETIDVPGFEAVWMFQHLEELQAGDESAFTYAQAVAVSEIEDWHFRGVNFASVLVSHEAVRWVLCFPVIQEDGVHYALQTRTISPDGDDVFYTFDSVASAASPGAPVHAVPVLDNLRFLSPQPGDKLMVIRAGDCRWDENDDTVFILPEDVLEVEIIFASEVRVL